MGEVVIRTCVCCDGTGNDSMYEWKSPCPVCHGKGRTAHRWEGDTFVPLDPDQPDLFVDQEIP